MELEFAPGDKVYLSTKNLVTDKGAKKLSDLHTGPFKVIKKVGDGAYKLRLPPHVKVNPVFNVALLTKWQPNPIPGWVQLEPAPIIVDGHEEYIIKKILDSNWLGKHFQYKVTYDGYGKEHNEWLFRDNLLEDLGAESLEDYEKEFYGRHPMVKRHMDEIRTRTKGKQLVKKKWEDLLQDLAVFWGGTVTKPTPYSNSTHFSDHFAYHITFPFIITWWSGSCQAHQTATMLLCTWPRAHSRDCQPHHVTVSLTLYLPFTLLATHSCLLHYYSALPLTFTLTPWCSLTFSLVCHLYLATLPILQFISLPSIPTPHCTLLSGYLCHHSHYICHSP